MSSCKACVSGPSPFTLSQQGIEHIARMLFVEKAGRPMQLMLDNCGSVKMLACFCTDMLVRGVVLLYGGEAGAVRLDHLGMAEFEHVADLMRCTGIVVKLLYDDDCDVDGLPVDMSSELLNAPDGQALEKYRVHLRPSQTARITLWFTLSRPSV
jgi:hypothetical protein